MLDAASRHLPGVGHASGAVVVGSGGVNVPPTVTAVVLVAGVVAGLFAVLMVLLCCRFCCSDVRQPNTTLIRRKRFVSVSTEVAVFVNI